MTNIDQLHKNRVLFVTGKGGVGKTTLCKVLQAHFQKQKPTQVIKYLPKGHQNPHFDPHVITLQPEAALKEYVLKIVKFEALYKKFFENKAMRSFIHMAPGLSDCVNLGKIWDLSQKNPHTLYIVDMPSTGHALSCFESPYGAQKIMSSGFIAKEIKKTIDLIQSNTTQVLMVSLLEEAPFTEIIEFHQKIKERLEKPVASIIINKELPPILNTLDPLFEHYTQLHQQQSEWKTQYQTQFPLITFLPYLASPCDQELIMGLAQELSQEPHS